MNRYMIAAVVCLFGSTAYGQAPSTEERIITLLEKLDARIQALEGKVGNIEARLARLEGRSTGPTTYTPSYAPATTVSSPGSAEFTLTVDRDGNVTDGHSSVPTSGRVPLRRGGYAEYRDLRPTPSGGLTLTVNGTPVTVSRELLESIGGLR